MSRRVSGSHRDRVCLSLPRIPHRRAPSTIGDLGTQEAIGNRDPVWNPVRLPTPARSPSSLALTRQLPYSEFLPTWARSSPKLSFDILSNTNDIVAVQHGQAKTGQHANLRFAIHKPDQRPILQASAAGIRRNGRHFNVAASLSEPHLPSMVSSRSHATSSSSTLRTMTPFTSIPVSRLSYVVRRGPAKMGYVGFVLPEADGYGVVVAVGVGVNIQRVPDPRTEFRGRGARSTLDNPCNPLTPNH